MKILPNIDLLSKIMKAVEQNMSREKGRDDKLHASDLSSPLKAYWQRRHPLPPTNYEIGYWLTGRAHHYHVVFALTGVDDTQEESCWSDELQLLWSPDLNALDGEFKTTRMYDEPEDDAVAQKFFRHYISQCKTYAVAKKKTKWNLVVLFICPSDLATRKLRAPFVRAYTLVFTKKELTEHKAWIESTRKKLELALKNNDPSELELCDENFCVTWKGQGRGKPSLVEPICKFFQVCKPKSRYDLWLSPPKTIAEKRLRKAA